MEEGGKEGGRKEGRRGSGGMMTSQGCQGELGSEDGVCRGGDGRNLGAEGWFELKAH